MTVLDFVILAILAISMIIGFFKGLLKQVLTLVGIIVVALLTATFSPMVQSWFVKLIENDNVRVAVAMFATLIILSVVYGVIAWLIGKLLKKVTIIKILDKILGGLMGILVVYFVFAVIFAVFLDTNPNFLKNLKNLLGDSFENGWFGQHIYGGGKNFFGNWVIQRIAQKLIDAFQPAAALI